MIVLYFRGLFTENLTEKIEDNKFLPSKNSKIKLIVLYS